MPKTPRLILPLVLAVAVAAVAGCRSLTDANPLKEFQWIAVENPAELQEGMDAAVFSGDIHMLGQVKTPTLCYGLSADFDRRASDLTLHVSADSRNSPDCATRTGGYRYTAVLRNLGPGTFNLRVVHSVAGVGETTYTNTLEIL